MNFKYMDWVIVLCTLVLLFSFAWFFINARGDLGKCTSDPLKYAIERYADRTGGNPEITVTFDNPQLIPFKVTKDGYKPLVENKQPYEVPKLFK